MSKGVTINHSSLYACSKAFERDTILVFLLNKRGNNFYSIHFLSELNMKNQCSKLVFFKLMFGGLVTARQDI